MAFDWLKARRELFSDPQKTLLTELENAVQDSSHPLHKVILVANGCSTKEIANLIHKVREQLPMLVKTKWSGIPFTVEQIKILMAFFSAMDVVEKGSFPASLLVLHRVYYFDICQTVNMAQAVEYAKTADYESLAKLIPDRVPYSNFLRLMGERYDRGLFSQKKSRPDGLQKLIELFVKQNPELTEPELRTKLKGEIRKGIIEEMDDDGDIEWHDAKTPAGVTPISGLKDRLSRAKKKLKKADSQSL